LTRLAEAHWDLLAGLLDWEGAVDGPGLLDGEVGEAAAIAWLRFCWVWRLGAKVLVAKELGAL
jgi:hypothetical protein